MKQTTILTILQVITYLTLTVLISFTIILFVDINSIASLFHIKIDHNENAPSLLELLVF